MWATKARLEQTRVIAAADKTAGRTVVDSLRILPPGAAPVPASADVVPAYPAPGRAHRSGQGPGNGV